MIYTIGHTEAYRNNMKKFGVKFQKMGKTEDYTGGAVWRTEDDAQNYLDRHNMKDYSVWAVEADWVKDTIISPYDYNYLINNSRILYEML